MKAALAEIKDFFKTFMMLFLLVMLIYGTHLSLSLMGKKVSSAKSYKLQKAEEITQNSYLVPGLTFKSRSPGRFLASVDAPVVQKKEILEKTIQNLEKKMKQDQEDNPEVKELSQKVEELNSTLDRKNVELMTLQNDNGQEKSQEQKDQIEQLKKDQETLKKDLASAQEALTQHQNQYQDDLISLRTELNDLISQYENHDKEKKVTESAPADEISVEKKQDKKNCLPKVKSKSVDSANIADLTRPGKEISGLENMFSMFTPMPVPMAPEQNQPMQPYQQFQLFQLFQQFQQYQQFQQFQLFQQQSPAYSMPMQGPDVYTLANQPLNPNAYSNLYGNLFPLNVPHLGQQNESMLTLPTQGPLGPQGQSQLQNYYQSNLRPQQNTGSFQW